MQQSPRSLRRGTGGGSSPRSAPILLPAAALGAEPITHAAFPGLCTTLGPEKTAEFGIFASAGRAALRLCPACCVGGLRAPPGGLWVVGVLCSRPSSVPLTPALVSPAARDDRPLPGGVFHHLQTREARPARYRCHPLVPLHPAEIKRSFGDLFIGVNKRNFAQPPLLCRRPRGGDASCALPS